VGDHDDRVIRRLNQEFYSASPADHFRLRAAVLMQFGDGSVPSGTETGNFTSDVLQRLPGWSLLREPADPTQQMAALTLESFMLAHHAGESLLRHYLALLDARNGGSPWLALSQLQGGSEFKTRLQAITQTPGQDHLRDGVGFCFLGDRSMIASQLGEDAVSTTESWIAAWLRHFADFYLDTYNGYNSAKHGLSSLPGHKLVSLSVPGDNDSDSVPLLRGASLETLEYTIKGKGAERRQHWYRMLRTVDPASLLAFVLIAAELLDTLWNVGRAHHLGGKCPIKMFDGPTPADVTTGHATQWGDLKVSIGTLPQEDS
jgi:hypothetical protein